ncbi:MAG TPA: TetR/AcrR family transcriptional regulator [Acidobacteriota bacterium]|nr:TetR/AcrR family transcriptional regulator [Acidobacteriota bacterium]
MKPKPLPKNGKNSIFPTTPNGTELASYDQKLNFILHTSAQVFAEKGYDRASLRDISRATGFSLAGLYYYFRSKEELLFLISDITFATIWKRLEQALTPQDSEELPAIEQLNRLIFNHLDFYVAHMPEMKVLSVEADALSGEWQKQVNDRKRRYTERCVKILTDLQAQAGREPNPTECRLSALALFGMMNWLYQWYDPKRDGSPVELSTKMSTIFLHGFLPREIRTEDSQARS